MHSLTHLIIQVYSYNTYQKSIYKLSFSHNQQLEIRSVSQLCKCTWHGLQFLGRQVSHESTFVSEDQNGGHQEPGAIDDTSTVLSTLYHSTCGVTEEHIH